MRPGWRKLDHDRRQLQRRGFIVTVIKIGHSWDVEVTRVLSEEILRHDTGFPYLLGAQLRGEELLEGLE